MNARKAAGYWTTTTVLALVLLAGGVADLARVPATTAGVLALGYPAYFVTILGTWKVLGGIAVLAPRFPRLKEWAYAGAFFNFTGAAISHLVSGSHLDHVVWTSLFTACTIASWALRPHSRTLPTRQPAAMPAVIPARPWRVRAEAS
jgi:uncharacterized membrane protein YphA (DoxX/SURF4 family)